MLPARHNNWMPDIFNDFFDTNWMDRPKARKPPRRPSMSSRPPKPMSWSSPHRA